MLINSDFQGIFEPPTRRPYFGERIHLVKNNIYFDLGIFFTSQILTNYQNVAVNKLKFAFLDTYKNVIDSPSTNTARLGAIHISGTNAAGRIYYDNTITDPTPDNVTIVAKNVYLEANKPISIYFNITFHDAIDSVWLTPNTIKVFKEGFSHGFSIYAKFTDGTVADVTGYHSNDWSFINNADEYLEWTFPRNGKPGQQNGTFFCKGIPNNPSPDIINTASGITDAIKVTLHQNLSNSSTPLSCQGKVIDYSTKTSTLDFPDINTLKSHLSTNLHVNNCSNIIFLPDGYTKTEKSLFNTHVENIVTEFTAGKISQPWSKLSDSMNFWSWFIESENDFNIVHGECIEIGTYNSGLFVRTAFTRVSDYVSVCDGIISSIKKTNSTGYDPSDLARTIWDGNPILGNTDTDGFIIWSIASADLAKTTAQKLKLKSLSDLIALVGFPSVQDLPTNDSLVLLNNFSSKLSFWQNLISNWDNDFVSLFTYHLWTKLATRICLEQPDTPFCTASGEFFRRRDEIISYTGLAISPYRSGDRKSDPPRNIHNVISRLKDSKGTNVGQLFFKDDGVSLNLKDNYYIVILSKIPGGTSGGQFIGLNFNDVGPYLISLVYRGPNSEVELEYDYTSSKVHLKGRSRPTLSVLETSTALHEFTHNWVQDEYGGPYVYNPESKFQLANNIQSKKSLENGSQLKTQNIKWLWPRITKIGLIQSIVVNPDVITVTITDFDEKDLLGIDPSNKIYGRFIKEDYVILIDIIPLIAHKDISAVTHPNTILTDPQKREFPMFRVVSEPKYKKNSIEVSMVFIKYVNSMGLDRSALPNTLPNQSDYDLKYTGGKGHLIRPWWDTEIKVGTTLPDDSKVPDQYCSIIHPTIVQAMKNGGLVEVDTYDYHGIQEPAAVVGLPKVKGPLGLIVGLYAGGLNQYKQGIYHGSGICLMRNETVVTIPLEWSKRDTSFLCPVCCYTVISSINYKSLPAYNMYFDKHYPE